MIYKLINSQAIIGKIFEDYNVDYSDFISRVPNWAYSALRKLNIYAGYPEATIDGVVEDYKCPIPPQTKMLVGVSYYGLRLPRMSRVNEKVTDDMPELMHPDYKYDIATTVNDTEGQPTGDGYIITTFAEGDIKFYIKSLPLVKDEVTQLWFPLIPDVEEVKDAITHYVILKLLQRGHKVGSHSLTVNNEFLNPGLAWNLDMKRATNAATRMDADAREVLSKDIRTFIQNYNFYQIGNFNPTENRDEFLGTYN